MVYKVGGAGGNPGAEGGQSKLKGDRKISLIESVLEDAVSMLVHAANYENLQRKAMQRKFVDEAHHSMIEMRSRNMKKSIILSQQSMP